MAAVNSPAAELLSRLTRLQRRGILIGQQDATAYGVHWKGGTDRSDCRDVCGSHPALIGWDGLDTIPPAPPETISGRRSLLLLHHAAGGISTLCWHMPNPVTGGPYHDTTPAVSSILHDAGTKKHYRSMLSGLASFLRSLVLPDGGRVPVLLRLFHEFDAPWFWWGSRYCSAEAFTELWRFTHDYLFTEEGIGHAAIVWSPDRNFSTMQELLERYPGDSWVDVIGMDEYHDFKFPVVGTARVIRRLQIISQAAAERGKLAALTETGRETIPDPEWFTQKLYPAITAEGVALSYCMLWRNDNPGHHYTPYPGHPAAADFRKFRELPGMLFLEDLQG